MPKKKSANIDIIVEDIIAALYSGNSNDTNISKNVKKQISHIIQLVTNYYVNFIELDRKRKSISQKLKHTKKPIISNFINNSNNNGIIQQNNNIPEENNIFGLLNNPQANMNDNDIDNISYNDKINNSKNISDYLLSMLKNEENNDETVVQIIGTLLNKIEDPKEIEKLEKFLSSKGGIKIINKKSNILNINNNLNKPEEIDSKKIFFKAIAELAIKNIINTFIYKAIDPKKVPELDKLDKLYELLEYMNNKLDFSKYNKFINDSEEQKIFEYFLKNLRSSKDNLKFEQKFMDFDKYKNIVDVLPKKLDIKEKHKDLIQVNKRYNSVIEKYKKIVQKHSKNSPATNISNGVERAFAFTLDKELSDDSKKSTRQLQFNNLYNNAKDDGICFIDLMFEYLSSISNDNVALSAVMNVYNKRKNILDSKELSEDDRAKQVAKLKFDILNSDYIKNYLSKHQERKESTAIIYRDALDKLHSESYKDKICGILEIGGKVIGTLCTVSGIAGISLTPWLGYIAHIAKTYGPDVAKYVFLLKEEGFAKVAETALGDLKNTIEKIENTVTKLVDGINSKTASIDNITQDQITALNINQNNITLNNICGRYDNYLEIKNKIDSITVEINSPTTTPLKVIQLQNEYDSLLADLDNNFADLESIGMDGVKINLDNAKATINRNTNDLNNIFQKYSSNSYEEFTNNTNNQLTTLKSELTNLNTEKNLQSQELTNKTKEQAETQEKLKELQKKDENCKSMQKVSKKIIGTSVAVAATTIAAITAIYATLRIKNNKKNIMTEDALNNSIYDALKNTGILKDDTNRVFAENFIKDFSGRVLAEWNINTLNIYSGNSKRDTMFKIRHKDSELLFDIDINKLIMTSLKNSIESLIKPYTQKSKDDIIKDIQKRFENTAYVYDTKFNRLYNKYDKHSIFGLNDKGEIEFRTSGNGINKQRDWLYTYFSNKNISCNINNFGIDSIYENSLYLEKIRRYNKTKKYKNKLLQSYKKNNINSNNIKLFNMFNDLNKIEGNDENKSNDIEFFTFNDNQKKDIKISKNTFYYDCKSNNIYFCDEVCDLIKVGKLAKLNNKDDDVVLIEKKDVSISRTFNKLVDNKLKKHTILLNNDTAKLKDTLNRWYKEYKQNDLDLYLDYKRVKHLDNIDKDNFEAEFKAIISRQSDEDKKILEKSVAEYLVGKGLINDAKNFRFEDLFNFCNKKNLINYYKDFKYANHGKSNILTNMIDAVANILCSDKQQNVYDHFIDRNSGDEDTLGTQFIKIVSDYNEEEQKKIKEKLASYLKLKDNNFDIKNKHILNRRNLLNYYYKHNNNKDIENDNIVVNIINKIYDKCKSIQILEDLLDSDGELKLFNKINEINNGNNNNNNNNNITNKENLIKYYNNNGYDKNNTIIKTIDEFIKSDLISLQNNKKNPIVEYIENNYKTLWADIHNEKNNKIMTELFMRKIYKGTNNFSNYKKAIGEYSDFDANPNATDQYKQKFLLEYYNRLKDNGTNDPVIKKIKESYNENKIRSNKIDKYIADLDENEFNILKEELNNNINKSLIEELKENKNISNNISLRLIANNNKRKGGIIVPKTISNKNNNSINNSMEINKNDIIDYCRRKKHNIDNNIIKMINDIRQNSAKMTEIYKYINDDKKKPLWNKLTSYIKKNNKYSNIINKEKFKSNKDIIKHCKEQIIKNNNNDDILKALLTLYEEYESKKKYFAGIKEDEFAQGILAILNSKYNNTEDRNNKKENIKKKIKQLLDKKDAGDIDKMDFAELLKKYKYKLVQYYNENNTIGSDYDDNSDDIISMMNEIYINRKKAMASGKELISFFDNANLKDHLTGLSSSSLLDDFADEFMEIVQNKKAIFNYEYNYLPQFKKYANEHPELTLDYGIELNPKKVTNYGKDFENNKVRSYLKSDLLKAYINDYINKIEINENEPIVIITNNNISSKEEDIIMNTILMAYKNLCDKKKSEYKQGLPQYIAEIEQKRKQNDEVRKIYNKSTTNKDKDVKNKKNNFKISNITNIKKEIANNSIADNAVIVNDNDFVNNDFVTLLNNSNNISNTNNKLKVIETKNKRRGMGEKSKSSGIFSKPLHKNDTNIIRSNLGSRCYNNLDVHDPNNNAMIDINIGKMNENLDILNETNQLLHNNNINNIRNNINTIRKQLYEVSVVSNEMDIKKENLINTIKKKDKNKNRKTIKKNKKSFNYFNNYAVSHIMNENNQCYDINING